jgi:hypothetical protein
MMRCYMHDGPAAFRFELAGDLDAGDAARLDDDWHTAFSNVGSRTLIVDVSFVTGIDAAVRSLFRRWYAGGAEFAASSKRSRELVEWITERPFTQEPRHAPTYRPWFPLKSFSRKSMPLTVSAIPLLALLALLTLVSALHAAELKPETLSAWASYIQSADAAMQARLRPGNSFLWIDEAPDRRRRVRVGEILVTGVGEHNPKRVSCGLIHHWMGAAFFPNAKLDDVFGVVRDYAHYKDYYHPNVIGSRTIQQTSGVDRFSMLLVNKALLLKTALDSEYESSYAQAGSGKWYSVATAVRVQEVEDYGEAGERKLPSDEGSGYVWRLHSITRYEEADGGVYVEMEAMALSRDIPTAVRWLADPIVRRVSKEAIVTSFRQTLSAVNSSAQVAAARSVAIPGLASGFLPSSPQH